MNENFVETSASSGDQKLGGGDFDNKLMEFCINYFSEKIARDQTEKNIDKKYISDKLKTIIYQCKDLRLHVNKQKKH